MKPLPHAILTVAMALLAAFASEPVLAQHYGHGGGARFGIDIGIPLYWPGYYPPPYCPYPVYPYPVPAYGYPQAVPAPGSLPA
jgi:hypothetical protein